MFVDTGLFTTVSDQSLIGDVIREAHGTNVAGAAAEAGPVELRRPAPARPGRLPRHLGHGSQPRRPAPEPADAEAPRDPGRPVRHRRRRPPRAGPGDRRGPRRGRAPAASRCVSLSSTPSPSTATERSCGSSTRCPCSPARSRSAGSSETPDVVQAAFLAEVAYYRPAALRGPRRREPGVAAAGVHAGLPGGRGGRPRSRVVRRRVHGRDRDGAEPGAVETLRSLARAGARARRRLQLGHRPRRAPRAPRARVALLGDRDHRGGGRAEAGPRRLPARARAARSRRRRGRCTSATSPGTRRAQRPPGCVSRTHRSPTAFEGWA